MVLPPDAPPAKVEVRGPTTVNAGEVDYAQPRDFTFTVANVGGQALDLTLTRKSCSCAESKPTKRARA